MVEAGANTVNERSKSDVAVDGLHRTYRCRDEQIDGLYAALSHPPVRALVLTGAAATGKSTLLHAVLKATNAHRRLVTADCVCAGSDRLLFTSLLQEVQCLKSNGNASASLPAVGGASEFARVVAATEEPLVFVLDRAERLRSCEKFSPRVLHVLLRLSELAAPADVIVVLVSDVRWERFVDDDPSLPPVACLAFPTYNREEMLQLLCAARRGDEEYAGLCSLVLNVMFNACRDLRELRRAVDVLYLPYVTPLRNGEVKQGDAAAQYEIMRPHLRSVMKALYQRSTATESDSINEATESTCTTAAVSRLSYDAKFLLLAAYLAARIPPRMDRKHFTSERWNLAKKQRRSNVPKKETKGVPPAQSVVPRNIPFERLLAIVRALRQQHCEDTTPAEAVISTPVFVLLTSFATSGLLTRVGESLNEPKIRSKVSESLAVEIAKALHIDLDTYTQDAAEPGEAVG